MRTFLILMAASLFCATGNAQKHDKSVEPVKIVCSLPIARITKQMQPEYPPLARQTGVQGNVLLRVAVGKDGIVKTITAVSGHPLLIKSTTDAVAQWQYKPLLINEKPVEIETTVTVIYKLLKEKKQSDSH